MLFIRILVLIVKVESLNVFVAVFVFKVESWLIFLCYSEVLVVAIAEVGDFFNVKLVFNFFLIFCKFLVKKALC
jgi:hypothetical protein